MMKWPKGYTPNLPKSQEHLEYKRKTFPSSPPASEKRVEILYPHQQKMHTINFTAVSRKKFPGRSAHPPGHDTHLTFSFSTPTHLSHALPYFPEAVRLQIFTSPSPGRPCLPFMRSVRLGPTVCPSVPPNPASLRVTAPVRLFLISGYDD